MRKGCSLYSGGELTSLNYGRFVTGADREDFEDSAGGPQKLLVGVGPHDVHQRLGAATGQNDELQEEEEEEDLHLVI